MRYSSGRLSAPLGQQRRAGGLLIEATTRRGLRSSLDQLGAWSPGKILQNRHDQGYDVDARRADEGSLSRRCRGRSLF
jgi:hypothetical protein